MEPVSYKNMVSPGDAGRWQISTLLINRIKSDVEKLCSPAQQIVAAIGGVDNVAAVTHCMTRLRFVVKDDEQVDSSTLKGWPGCWRRAQR
ncbi:PTS transporter subunit EIIB [Klebsiella pneumoniae]|uniref:PTS transporter subunit EIIB n=1 Tax=Klebsiella pneumoniae TaxID=573 RepID=A0A939NR43_KLEPN|nr:PTS transporter subunit EIIB [Klebsiella pneumoniae]